MGVVPLNTVLSYSCLVQDMRIFTNSGKQGAVGVGAYSSRRNFPHAPDILRCVWEGEETLSI